MGALGAVVKDESAIEVAPFGLLSRAVTVIEDSDPHWVNKMQYESTTTCSSTVTLSSICNTSVSATAVESSGSPLFRDYYPFDIQTEFMCSTMGTSPEEVLGIARNNLDACAQKALEYEFWTGSLASAAAADSSWDEGVDGLYPNRYLSSADAVDVTPTPGTGVRAKHGLALLEGALADCGCGIVGTIHMTRETASVLNNLKNKDGVLTTNLGNKAVAGSGYTGSGPGNADPGPGLVWMYATGPVTVRLGDVLVTPDMANQAVDTATNSTQYYAQRPGAVTWNSCCHYAVLVDLSLEYA